MSSVFEDEFWESEGELRGRGGRGGRGGWRRPSASRTGFRGGAGRPKPRRRPWPKRPWLFYRYRSPSVIAAPLVEPVVEAAPPPEEPLRPPEPPLPEPVLPPEEEPPADQATGPDGPQEEEWRVRRRLRWQGLA